ncbi:unnamed protein product [Rhizoctonia solani]|uniref:Uncharacterized protein n=1 Tax=Rhizoctonia solani TaxID=456999 RepID=A0A8H3GZN9_9AGAM|nr:unnamed protein product [Rhizoctonia solani]
MTDIVKAAGPFWSDWPTEWKKSAQDIITDQANTKAADHYWADWPREWKSSAQDIIADQASNNKVDGTGLATISA